MLTLLATYFILADVIPFRGSAAVAQETVNLLVAGSNPALGALENNGLHGHYFLLLYKN